MSKTTINDMTIGSPAKLIIKFMIPMCLGNLFQQFYNVVDSIVAGTVFRSTGTGRNWKYRFFDVLCHWLA